MSTTPINELDIEELDGVNKPYVPAEEIDVPGDVSLHDEVAADVDPVTYKVIQHRLWNVNQQHGEIIENLAVSPITLETRDFQTGIQQADGDFVYFGQFLQYFAGVLDLNVKWTLENRSENPGIEPGDMFLSNDPWICAPHQNDVTLAAPVFHDGEIFCWVANVAHQNDVGGTVAGSFCQDADDIFDDPVPIPPTKIVEGGEIRRDVEEAYRRHSREPTNLGLDFRAQVAGNNHAREQIQELIEEYGADTVKAVMYRISDNSDAALSELLSAVPDGVWEERMYQEVAKTGDRSVHQVRIRLEKAGDTLRFDNEGTDPNVGAINLPFCGWRGAILTALNFLLPEEMGAVGGIERHVQLEPEIGTLTAPEYGVATSPAGMYATHPAVSMAGSVVSKMLLSSEDEALREKAMSWYMAKAGMTILAGTNQRGEFFVGPMMDGMLGAGGALPDRDGQFANGTSAAPEGKAPNAEFYERDWPILYLYREEQPDGAGEGYRRGGNSGRVAYVQHDGAVDPTAYANEATPVVHGLFGGGPSSRVQSRIKRGTDVYDRFEANEIPGDLSEVDGEIEHLPGKGAGIQLGEDDVHEFTWEGAAGYGDPLDREPKRVVDDLEVDRISEGVALDAYGVVLDDDGDLDESATAERRTEMRHDRLRESNVDRDEADVEAGETPIPEIRERDGLVIGDYLAVDGEDVSCSKCDHDLGTVDANVKEHLAVRAIEIEELGPNWIDTSIIHDADMEFREFFCPGCATRVTTEIAEVGDDYVNDVSLRL